MAPRKKSKTRTARRAAGGPAPEIEDAEVDEGAVVDIPDEPEPEPDGDTVSVNAETGSVTITHDDGSITIDPTGASQWQVPQGDPSHEENLALKIDPLELARIAEDLLTAIEADKQDRSQWEQMRAKCIELLGLKLEDPKGDVSRSALGMSTSVVRDPVLLQAVEFFRANAYAELCPAAGPVKVVNFAEMESMAGNDLADALQSDLNYYLTTTASEYYPDTYYMLWWTGLASGTFKKVYKCPLRRRPVSEYVDGTHLIVPSAATDLKNAGRVTHEIQMRKSVMRRMQILGVYRDFMLTDPLPVQNSPVEDKRANIEGKAPTPQRIEDQEYTVYECYCELDIKGFEHKEEGEAQPSGLSLPYRVTVDASSRQILEIRRNWEEEDEDHIAQIPFVLFPFSTGLSRIYGSGLGQMMGNVASALTALLRISIDNGVLGNYPGLIKAKGPGRDINNEIIVPPGGCVEIDTGGLPIQQFVMGLPYKDVSGNVMQLMEQTRGVAQRLGGTADIPMGEGRQDAPVGTTLALIEQATKPASATHKVLHAAQSEEFRLLVKLFKDDPEALWRGNRRPAMGATTAERLAKFKAAIDNCDIVPMADPNVPSEMHRKLIAMGLKTLTMGNPAYDQVAVDRYIAKTVYKMPDADFRKFLAPPQPAGPDPTMLALQIEQQKVGVAQQKVQVDAAKVQHQAEAAAADREARQNVDAMKVAAQFATGNDKAAPQPSKAMDPFQMAQLSLKQQGLELQQAKLAVDTHQKQRELDSKEAVEAFKIVQTAGIHPEATEIMDGQMQQLAPFIQQAAQDRGGAANGGPILPAETDDERTVKLAIAIAQALQERQQSGYMN